MNEFSKHIRRRFQELANKEPETKSLDLHKMIRSIIKESVEQDLGQEEYTDLILFINETKESMTQLKKDLEKLIRDTLVQQELLSELEKDILKLIK